MALTASPKKNLCTFVTVLFLIFFLLTIFVLFTKQSIKDPVSVYRNFFTQTPSSTSSSASSTSMSSISPSPSLSSISPSLSSISPSPSSSDVHYSSSESTPSPVQVVLPAHQSISPNLQIDSKDSQFSNKNNPDKLSGENEKNPDARNGLLGETVGGGGGDSWLEKMRKCDLYKGTWVKDEQYPIYKPGSCPFVDEAFDCQHNGRPDSEYLKWRWNPDGCDLPRFNATDFLLRLRGKKLMLVGDSMNRNQFESILCLLYESLPNKSRMYEINGHKITKGRGYYVFMIEDYDCTIDFVRSHFLVKEGLRINGQGSSNPTLSIDRIDKTSSRWKRADILVFNTGHWWNHGKTARGKNYYKEGDYLYPQFDALKAYRRALKTWANWIDRNVNPEKQLVFYRGYSSAHFRGGDWDSGGSCNGETEPVFGGGILHNYPLTMKVVEEVIKEMRVPVKLINVTRLTNFRKDGHPSIYGKLSNAGKKIRGKKQDCSHWCLPGVPDVWNELIYATLVFHQTI